MCGSAGCYDGSGLKAGDLAVASTEILAELGLCHGPGIGSAAALGLGELDQDIRLDRELVEQLVRAADSVAETRVVRSLTVVGVSADFHQARARSDRFSANVENMEGYAAALCGLRYNIPVGEVRGISNIAGDRDKFSWNLALANERAQIAVMNCLERLVEKGIEPA
jgi:futalosine hydrolase